MITEEMAIALLREKECELGRTPKKEDFLPQDVARIKSKLGPWPRALEKAGLKAPGPRSARKAAGKKAKKRSKTAGGEKP